ncbi:gliding motility-associated peptidyl-prolyl isomerase GldI [Maribacter sp. ANRC-HE7]|uniref:Peptidyl-prolyl cis-trans isomerase n=1 Tax=Maribacter aquimaris TaxID=2737171 RepID=A0ABR7V1M9_9FLAO|nr:gliding motility-associated peptidyl-prolyl isomerase GldI [Maribacter aquimaris]MBD0778734.1 gliding motility-associated peptidyl-prolyl isomerase GldI [Maribacter aquimaris]
MKKLPLILLIITLASCGGPEPRRPVQMKTSTINTSIERSKKLLVLEESMIEAIIKKDSINEYTHSNTGAWYYYVQKNDEATYTPQPNDMVTMTYTVMGFNNDTIYTQDEIGIFNYIVDKQELFPGLRNSVKLLKEKETATFLFPSSLAYGYHGDDNKIGVNVPIKATVTLLAINKQQDSTQN